MSTRKPSKRTFSRRRRPATAPTSAFAQKVRSVQFSSVETKRKQMAVVSQAVGSDAPVNVLLHDIDTGDTLGSRDGEEVYFRGVLSRASVAYNSASANPSQAVRFIIYHPRQQNDILTTAGIYSYIEPERYQVYLDRTYLVDTNGPTAKFMTLGKRFHNSKIPGLKMKWKSGTGTDITKGALYLYITSDTTVAANPPTVNATTQVFYKDP